MKRTLISAIALFSVMTPFAAHATPTAASPAATATQAICIPVIVETPEGPVEGVLCFPQGGRV